MALNLLTADELRARAGAALPEGAMAGVVEDSVFEQIVAEGAAALDSLATSAARDRYLSGGRLLVGEPISLLARESGHAAGLYRVDIPERYLAFVFRVELPSGGEAAYDDDLRTLVTSPFQPRAYRVQGRVCEVLASEEITAITAYLAETEDVIAEVAGEAVGEVNDAMTRKAERALAARVAEQTRQETYTPPED